MLKYNRKGFTLVEILVVIVILGILATIGIAGYQGLIGGANDTKRKSDITEIEKVITTVNAKGLKPTSLGQVADEFDEYPVDPINGYGYQYNVNTDTASSRYRKYSGKGYVICTNAPLEKFVDNNGDVLEDYMDDYEVDMYSTFVGGKLRNKNGSALEPITPNITIAHLCQGQTDDFNSLIAGGGGSNSLGTENCSESILNPDLTGSDLGQACRIVFNQEKTAQASTNSPAPGTPYPMPTE